MPQSAPTPMYEPSRTRASSRHLTPLPPSACLPEFSPPLRRSRRVCATTARDNLRGDHPVSDASEPAENAGVGNVGHGVVATNSQSSKWSYPLRQLAYPFILVFRFVILVFRFVARFFLGVAEICLVIFLIAAAVASFAFLLLRIFFGIFDLIFRTHVNNWIDENYSIIADWMMQTYSSAIEPILYPLWIQIVNLFD